MFQYPFIILFVLTSAFTSGGIFLASKLREKYRSDIFTFLLYFEVFIFTFGFYGIWGQAVIKVFLSKYISPEVLTRFSDISMLLGLPFLVFAWLMLIQFFVSLSGRKSNNWLVGGFLVFNFAVIIFVGYFISTTKDIRPVLMLKSFFIALNLTYTIISALLILLPGRGKVLISDFERRIISPSIVLITIAQCIPLLFYDDEIIIAVAFIIAFFAGNTFLPVYLMYGTTFEENKPENLPNISLSEFCRKFEVSPRESEIIREICNGLSNKEIADKLFISLQTVKDHTHRIYIKTNVRSRVQLITIVKELKSED
jgi:DNA-binding CsgD family transcriptional regulator